MYGKPAMTCFNYQVYLYGSKAVTCFYGAGRNDFSHIKIITSKLPIKKTGTLVIFLYVHEFL